MNWSLIRKDWRVNRVVVIGMLVVTVLPYFLATANLLVNPPESRSRTDADWVWAIGGAAIASLIFVVALSAAFGGVAFAAERRDRTAEFLAMLPVSRGAMITSKLLVAVACLSTVLIINFFVVYWSTHWLTSRGLHGVEELMPLAGLVTGGTCAIFGVAWALSVFLRSPAIAAAVAIALGIGMLFGGIAWAEKVARVWGEVAKVRTDEDVLLTIVGGFLGVFGMICVLVSAAVYARRVQP